MTTPTQQVTVISPGQAVLAQPAKWSTRDAQLLASVISRDLDERDMHVYARICGHTGLDPFKKQIYAWKDKGRLAIHIAVGGWRAIASRTGNYGGLTDPQWCGPDGVWRDVWLEESPPAASRVGARIRGIDQPTYAVVTWREFERTQKRTGAKGPTQWDEKPAHMLAVRAEAFALQKAFPEAYEAAMGVVSDSKAILDVVDEGEIPALPAGLNTETGELEDVTPADTVDSPESRAEGESAREQSDPSSDADAPSPEAQQPGLMDAPLTTPRAFTDDDWHELGEDMASKQPPVVAQDMARVLGKPFNAANVAEWMREHDAPWGQLVDTARVRRAQASERG